MKWRRGVGGDQIQDRRGQRGGRGGLAAGGLGGLGIIGVIIALLSGGLGGGSGGGGGFGGIGLDGDIGTARSGGPSAAEAPGVDEQEDFLGFIVDDIQDTWDRLFADSGRQYQATELVLFEGSTQSGCGGATSEVGPHYCPADGLVYLDLGFFDDLQTRFGADGGDFATAYVVAHEFGHHIQNITGISEQVRSEQQQDPDAANELSVLLELQADCFAGVWGQSAEGELLDPGDLEEGISAAEAVGDDRIQSRATGQINPESWTHGSSEQRIDWFLEGFETGDPAACDTFDRGVEPS